MTNPIREAFVRWSKAITEEKLRKQESAAIAKRVLETSDIAINSLKDCLKCFEEYQHDREISALKHAIELKDLEIEYLKKQFDQFQNIGK